MFCIIMSFLKIVSYDPGPWGSGRRAAGTSLRLVGCKKAVPAEP